MPTKLLTTERAFDEAALEAETEAQAAFDKWQTEFKGGRVVQQQSPADAVDSPPNPDQQQMPAGGQPPQGY